MIVRHSAVARFIVSAGTVAFLAGCAATPMGPTVQVMPGPGKSFDAFQADNASCKSFAADQVRGQADAANQRAVGTAVLGTALGAGLGAAAGSLSGNAGAGAGVGAAVGATGGTVVGAQNGSVDQMNIQAQYDNAFAQCMYAKGEQVAGYAPVMAPAPTAAMPAPDPLIRATQSELIRLGILQDTADGYTGPKTRAAISSFEQSNGLPVDGTASPRLLAKLQATPTGAAPAPTTASAPTGWVAPTTSSGAAPAAAPAQAAPSGWVAPTKSP